MTENSKIEWTHHTFNPWIGCREAWNEWGKIWKASAERRRIL